MISIGSLEKSVNNFAKQLEKAGHKVTVSVYRSGSIKNCDTQRVSHVKLAVDQRHFKLMANGYCPTKGGDIGGIDMTWKEMKSEVLSRLNSEAR